MPSASTTRRGPAQSLENMMPPQTPTSGCTKFTLFNKLPPELRIKTWRFAMEARRITICFKRGDDSPLSRTQNPAVLGVNRESRIETLKHYKILFRGRDTHLHYFNYAVDILFIEEFPVPLKERQMTSIQPKMIRNLEIHGLHWNNRQKTLSWVNSYTPGSRYKYLRPMTDLGKYFTNLETITIVPLLQSHSGAKPLSANDKTLYETVVSDHFQGYKDSGQECSIPKVIVQGRNVQTT